MALKKIVKKPWSQNHINKFNWLYKYYKQLYPEAIQDNFIDLNKRNLMSLIENNPNWADGSKEGLLFMIARYLQNKGELRYSKLYSSKAHDITLKIRDNEDHNKLDNKEEANFRTHDFFIDILEHFRPDQIKTLTGHYKYLLLSMLVLQPPLRTSFYTTAKFLRSKADNNKTDNYIWINRRGMLKINYIINKDKASNYKVYNINKNLSSIPVEDKKLVKIINDSYDQYPRTYLFELNNKPVTSSTLLNWLKDITLVEGLNFDILRSSYITWFYEHNKTMAQKTKLAHQMRHSVDTASRNYLKVFDVDPIEQPNKNNELINKVAQLEHQISEYVNKLNAYQNIEGNDKTYKKRRSDIIYRLNKGVQPKEDTIKRYNINYDQTTRLYS